MKPPIVVIDDDIDVYGSAAEAERDLEPWSIREGRMRIYDGDGRRIRAVIAKKFLAETVKLEMGDGEDEPNELRRALVQFLSPREKLPEDTYREGSMDQLAERALRWKTR
ncbi:MAG TPA: hypothetical protein VJM31_09890 [Vicinamibacterales bacterium]|nr:hypothetical protein [Vicinamibacterales bacterium]